MKISAQSHAPTGAPAPNEPGGQWWLASDEAGLPLAALHAVPALGLSRARYSFHLGRVVHAAPELGLHQVQTTLQLGHDATGEAELDGFWRSEEADEAVLDALIATAVKALKPLRPEPGALVVAELPGWRDAMGRSPFWEGLVHPFLPQARVEEAAARLGPAFASHLGPLLPRQLMHVAFLPEATQQRLGQVADSQRPWLRALQRAGFSDWRHRRIDDGGPVLARTL
jgi:arginine/ornithine N-succinyltransferase beta subunit